MVSQSYQAMTPPERRRVSAMYGSILGLHLIGFTIFAAFVIPAHYRGLGIGVSVLAYTLGLRHAFDADHIAVSTSPGNAICCLPILFTAGMALLDTTDGIFMNLANGLAFFSPVRTAYYSLAITGLSVSISFLVGGIETLGLISSQVRGLSQQGGF